MAAAALSSPAEIVAFWRAAGAERWFKKDAAFDDSIRDKFLPTQEAAAAGRFSHWEASAEGALALLLLFDQFPRNMFRNSPRAFANDAMARAVAKRSIAAGFDRDMGPLRQFFFLPFMHSEDMADQERGIALYAAAGDDHGLKSSHFHADIIRKFGRFPHRNAVLGRHSTPEEIAFLDDGGFSG